MSSLLNQLSACSGLLPLTAVGLRFRTFGPVLRQLAWFFFISVLFDLVSVVTDHLRIRNIPLFHVFSVVNLLFLSALYHQALTGVLVRYTIRLAAGAILLYTVYSAGQPGQIWQFPSAVMTAQCVFFIVLSLIYFYQLLRQPVVVAIENNPLLWVNAGVLIYFSGNLFLFMLQAWISQTPQAQHYTNFWVIHSIVNILANLFYAAGLLCKPQRLT
ncbi:hypothetical protein IC235_09245 [Hymenobacter sp. BT664]|uniref:Uncharacterized protein n=1 Tax=Hymenobacter montanus TaxID=2771359 RepID=A0A927BDF2_9BACT|nr:hypothetical protein [Hymenobacter montanus]MBD2768074.1 hypothetical protein [Hymenobacter montanus]